ncbi:hypothetical protein QZH41_006584 [Actinostola sp. cb2023]|nr:hypothetical protein QZH41_006584 [Actinostola sp. cb2023]
MKRLKLAQAEGKDWRRELVRYLAVYRTTPQQTTGSTPAFLLMGRHPRTKLPELSQPVHGDEETRDRDQLMKFKSKQYADVKRNAKTSEREMDDDEESREETFSLSWFSDIPFVSIANTVQFLHG